MNGFIKLHRQMLDWEWYSDPVVRSVFIHILLIANWKETEYRGVTLKPGDAVIGLNSLASQLGYSVQQIRTTLKKLQNSKQINKRTTNKFTVVSVVNWASYQLDDDELTNEQQANQHEINSKITANQQHLKNIRNKEYKNNISISHSISKSIDRGLTQEEMDRLTDYYSDVDGLLEAVEKKVRLRKNSTPIRNMYGYVITCADDMGWPTRAEAEAKAAERNANLKAIQDFEDEARREREAREPLSEERKAELMERFGIGKEVGMCITNHKKTHVTSA